MMTILAKPSRSYAQVEHDDEGLSAVGNAPYNLSKKSTSKAEGGFKTYRPPLTETHLRRPLGYDPHPNSHFAPLPPAFQLSNKHKQKKDQALAGQRAELDHILQPGYKSTSNGIDGDGDSSSIAGPSRQSASRTAGGLNGATDRKGKNTAGLGIRPSASISSFKQAPNGVNGRRSGGLGGIYIDSDGKIHDTEFDPFGNVAEMSRRKSRRRSAFGSDRRRGSASSSSSESGSGDNEIVPARRSVDVGGHEGRDREEEEIRRRLEQERKRLDDVSGYAAARRRSMMSERSGRATPSIRSSEDGPVSTYSASLAPNGRTKSQQGYYIPSPLSPTFGHPPSGSSYNTTRTMPTTAEVPDGLEDSPVKSTEITKPSNPQPKSRVEVAPDGSKKITGFDAPITPVPPATPAMSNHLFPPSVPDTGRLSTASRGSSEYTRERPPKPAERPREELFPETPAQIKRREERERRSGRTSALGSRVNTLAVDTVIAGSGRGRILPEIEIVEDDDPRIVFPPDGKATRVQVSHDHVIRGPFGHALHAQSAAGTDSRRASSAKSLGGGSKLSSTMEDDGGYLPSRWANGDKALRVTEDEREKYRPMEWGGKHGDLAGRTDDWRPTAKDQVKRNLKDIATNARFSLFRTKKKLLRKADM